ncbi:MAG: hypothetical protein ACSHW9_10825, partial [Salinibacterium amurskyense]
SPVPYLSAEPLNESTRAFRPPVRDFQLMEITEQATVALTGTAIVLCVEGTFALSGELSSVVLTKGEAALITPDERQLATEGSGALYLAMPQ